MHRLCCVLLCTCREVLEEQKSPLSAKYVVLSGTIVLLFVFVLLECSPWCCVCAASHV